MTVYHQPSLFDVLLKVCTKCGEAKPGTREFFYVRWSKLGTLRAHCKVCSAAYRAEHDHQYKPRRKQLEAEYRSSNPEFHRARLKAWRDKNKEHCAAYRAAYYQANREAENEYLRQKREAHPELVQLQNMKQRALNGTVVPTRHEMAAALQSMYEGQGGLCAYCQHPLNANYHIDHMLPVSRGGGSNLDNLTLSCPSCNLRKGTKTAEEFRALIS